MPTIAPRPQSSYTPAPAGSHVARCFQFIQIGTVQEEYMGKPKMMNKVRLSFELPNEKKSWKEGEPEKPWVIHQKYTLSMAEKANLRKLIEGIIGTTLTDEEAFAFDTESLVGKACIVNIKHKTSTAGNVRAEIASTAPLMKGMECPAQFNPSNILTYTAWSDEKFAKLPDFLKEELMSSEEYKNRLTPQEKQTIQELRENEMKITADDKDTGSDISPDDIPF